MGNVVVKEELSEESRISVQPSVDSLPDLPSDNSSLCNCSGHMNELNRTENSVPWCSKFHEKQLSPLKKIHKFHNPNCISLSWSACMLNHSIQNSVPEQMEGNSTSNQQSLSKQVEEINEVIQHHVSGEQIEQDCENIRQDVTEIVEESSESILQEVSKLIEELGEIIQNNVAQMVEANSESIQNNVAKIVGVNSQPIQHDLTKLVEASSENIQLDVATENMQCNMEKIVEESSDVAKIVKECSERMQVCVLTQKENGESIEQDVLEQREYSSQITQNSAPEQAEGTNELDVTIRDLDGTSVHEIESTDSQSCTNSFVQVNDISRIQSVCEQLDVCIGIPNESEKFDTSVVNNPPLDTDKRLFIGFVDEVGKNNAIASFQWRGEKYSSFILKNKIEYEGRKVGNKLYADDLLIPKQQVTLHFNNEFKYKNGALVVSRVVLDSVSVNTEEMWKTDCFVFPPYRALVNNTLGSSSLHGTIELAFATWGTLSMSVNNKQKRAIFLKENVCINGCHIPDKTTLNLAVCQGMPVKIDINHNESSAKMNLTWYFGEIAYLTKNGGIIIFKNEGLEEKAIVLLENLYINKEKYLSNDLKDMLRTGEKVAFLTVPCEIASARLQATYLLCDNQEKNSSSVANVTLNICDYVINLLSISQKTNKRLVQSATEKKLYLSWNARDPLIDFLHLKKSVVNFKQASESLMKSIGHFKNLKSSLKPCENNYYLLLDILGTALIFGGLIWKEYIEILGSKDSMAVDLNNVRMSDVLGTVLEERILIVGVRKVLFHPNDVYINGERCAHIERGSVFHCTITELPHPGSFGETHFAWCVWQGMKPDIQIVFNVFEKEKSEALTVRENHWYRGHVLAFCPPQAALVSLCCEGNTWPVIVFDTFIEDKTSLFSDCDDHWVIDYINIGESLSVMLLGNHYKAVRAKKSCNFEDNMVCLQEKLNYVQGSVYFVCKSFGIVKFSIDGSCQYGVIMKDHLLIDGKIIESSVSLSKTLKFSASVMFCRDFINLITKHIHYIPAIYVCAESTQQNVQYNTPRCFNKENVDEANDNDVRHLNGDAGVRETNDIDVRYLNGETGILVDVKDDYGLLQCGVHKAVFHKSSLFLSGQKYDHNKSLVDVIKRGMKLYVVAVHTVGILFGLHTTHVCTCVWDSERPTIAKLFESFVLDTADNCVLKKNSVYYGTVAALAPPSFAIVSVKKCRKHVPVLLFVTSLAAVKQKIKCSKTAWINDYLVPGDILRIKISGELKNFKFLVADEGCKTNNIFVMTEPEKCDFMELFPDTRESVCSTFNLKANHVEIKPAEETLENEKSMLDQSLHFTSSITTKVNETSDTHSFHSKRSRKSQITEQPVSGNKNSRNVIKNCIKPGCVYRARVTEIKRFSFIAEVEVSDSITPVFVRNVSFCPDPETGKLDSRDRVTLHVNIGDLVYVKVKREKVEKMEWCAKQAWKETCESRSTDINVQPVQRNVQLGEKGQIIELTPEKGQLKTLSNQLIKFLRQNVHLYGLPLEESNLTEILSLGDTLSFSLENVFETADQHALTTKVWIGWCEVTSYSETYNAIVRYCSTRGVKPRVIENLTKMLSKYRQAKCVNEFNTSSETGDGVTECAKNFDRLGNNSTAEMFTEQKDFIPGTSSMSNSENMKPLSATEKCVSNVRPNNATYSSVLRNGVNALNFSTEISVENSDSEYGLVLNPDVRNILELSLDEVLYNSNFTSTATKFTSYVLDRLENMVQKELFETIIPAAVIDAVKHITSNNKAQNSNESSEMASRITDMWRARLKMLLDNFQFLDDISLRKAAVTSQNMNGDLDLVQDNENLSDELCNIKDNACENPPVLVDHSSQTTSTGNVLYLKLYSSDNDEVI